MLLHYARFGLRLLIADRWFSLVNLAGLTLGLASVALIGLYVRHELSYDSFLPDSETLYRVDTVETAPGQDSIEIALAPGPLAPGLRAQFPQVAATSRAFRLDAIAIRDGRPFAEKILAADPNFFSLLGLPLVAGTRERALVQTGSMAISERAAIKYFGTTEAVGRRLTLRLPQPRDFTVSAVFRTIPDNSHMDFDIVVPHAAYFGANSQDVMAIPNSWNGAYFHTYVRLRPGAQAADVERGLPALVDRSFPAALRELLSTPPHEIYRFRLVAVADIHLDGAAIEAMRPPSSRAALAALSVVATLILLIACINFANMLAARSSLRAREVALRKVVGARRRDIVLQFLIEALLVTGVAGFLSVVLVELALPWLESGLGLPASALDIGSVWVGMAALILATAGTAGVYPSVLVARIMPAAVFNRDSAARGGGRLRGALLVLQFGISICLVAVTIVMLLQWRLTQEMDLGFERDGLMVVRAPQGDNSEASARALADALARLPGVAGASLSSAVPSDVSEDNLTVRIAGQRRPVTIGFHRVDNHFFETYAVLPLAGRVSTARADRPGTDQRQRDTSAAQAVVINRSALNRLGLVRPEAAIGQVLRGRDVEYEIVGVVADLHFRSLHAPVRDELFILDEGAGTNVSLRIAPASEAAVAAQVERLWRERFPDVPIEHAMLSDMIGDLYLADARRLVLVTLFAVLAIILSCVGLLAMTAFTLQRRTKEIAVRKILGARTRDIVRLLLTDFLKPVLVANLIGLPIAWYVARDWLNSFSYRIDMPPLAFATATLATLVLAAAAVAVHSVRSAQLRPAPALRRE